MTMGFRIRVLAACFISLALSLFAVTAVHADLHVGSRGAHVKNLQWLISGHKPSHFRKFRPYTGRINGRYDRRTGKAVKRMKYRLGYPKKLLNRRTGPTLPKYLLGKTARPASYVVRQKKRTRYIRTHRPALTLCQRNIVKIANSQVGVHEVPYGSNSGFFVHIYQSVTGAYNAPWCASFAQWVLYRAHHGPIASRSASVYYIKWWAQRHGLLRSRPKPGTLVLFLSSQGHMGIVTAVSKSGTSFTSVEGNYSNSVARVHHGSLFGTAYVHLPHCSS